MKINENNRINRPIAQINKIIILKTLRTIYFLAGQQDLRIFYHIYLC